MKNTRTLTLVILACVAVAVAPAYATASIGTGVGAVPLVLKTPAKAGHLYTLPRLYVKNTGTVSSLYTVRVERITKGAGRSVPASWVHVDPTTFRLRPGVLRSLTVTVTVPAGAVAGAYATDLIATTTTPHGPGATALGAAAADGLSFQIAARSAFPWLPVGLAAGLLALLVGGLWVRRSGLRPQLRVSLRSA